MPEKSFRNITSSELMNLMIGPKTPLDEWVRFLKSGIIDENTTAKGLQAARERLRVSDMSEQERHAYERHMDNIRIQWDVLTTAHGEGWDEGRAEGKAEGLAEGGKAFKRA